MPTHTLNPGKVPPIFPNNTKEISVKLEIVKEIFEFLIKRKKFWLIPVIIILLLIGIILVLAEGTAIAPFIYTLF